jgi:hypothetical protein
MPNNYFGTYECGKKETDTTDNMDNFLCKIGSSFLKRKIHLNFLQLEAVSDGGDGVIKIEQKGFSDPKFK